MKPAPPVMSTRLPVDMARPQRCAAQLFGRGQLGPAPTPAPPLAREQPVEVFDGLREPLSQRDARLPAELAPRELDARTTLGRIVARQRQKRGLRARSSDLENELRELAN